MFRNCLLFIGEGNWVKKIRDFKCVLLVSKWGFVCIGIWNCFKCMDVFVFVNVGFFLILVRGEYLYRFFVFLGFLEKWIWID